MGYRWVKQLPFSVMLVHAVCYNTVQDADADKVNHPNILPGFVLMEEGAIATTPSYKVSIPLKRLQNE